MSLNTQQRREECRSEVRRYLAERSKGAFPASAIRRKLRMDGDDFTDDEVEAAALFLAELHPPQVKLVLVELGATKSWQITSAGILAHERAA